MHRTDLAGLSDDALVSCLSTLCAQGHALTARVIVHLIEVEERRLDLRAACTSMFDFCTRRLGMSEGAAFRRITAARLVKRFPALLERIERGEVHLSTLVVLRPHLTESNVEELAAAAAGKTRREVEDLLARLAPKPDVPSAIVELGIPSNDATPTLFTGAGAAASLGVANAGVAPSVARSRIEPLFEARFNVQLTAGAELKAKLERACDLMRHRNPNGELAVVIDAVNVHCSPSRSKTARSAVRSAPSAGTALVAGRTTVSPPRRSSARRTSRSASTSVIESHGRWSRRRRYRHRRRRKSSSSRCVGCETWASARPMRVEPWTTSRSVLARTERRWTCKTSSAARSWRSRELRRRVASRRSHAGRARRIHPRQRRSLRPRSPSPPSARPASALRARATGGRGRRRAHRARWRRRGARRRPRRRVHPARDCAPPA